MRWWKPVVFHQRTGEGDRCSSNFYYGYIWKYIYNMYYRHWKVHKTQPNGIQMYQELFYMFVSFFSAWQVSIMWPDEPGQWQTWSNGEIDKESSFTIRMGSSLKGPTISAKSLISPTTFRMTSNFSTKFTWIDHEFSEFFHDVGQWMILHMFRSGIFAGEASFFGMWEGLAWQLASASMRPCGMKSWICRYFALGNKVTWPRNIFQLGGV